jgi:hypothetical protein
MNKRAGFFKESKHFTLGRLDYQNAHKQKASNLKYNTVVFEIICTYAASTSYSIHPSSV